MEGSLQDDVDLLGVELNLQGSPRLSPVASTPVTAALSVSDLDLPEVTSHALSSQETLAPLDSPNSLPEHEWPSSSSGSAESDDRSSVWSTRLYDSCPRSSRSTTPSPGLFEFSIPPTRLADIVQYKRLGEFRALGTLDWVAKLLHTNLKAGLDPKGLPASDPEIGELLHIDPLLHAERIRVYGSNGIPEQKPKSFGRHVLESLGDQTLVVFMGILALQFGAGLHKIWTSSGQAVDELVQNSVLFASVLGIVVCDSAAQYEQARQFARLANDGNRRFVNAVRGGQSIMVSITDIVVGDVLRLKPGDIVPADGVLICGDNITCDESLLTGESKRIPKTPANGGREDGDIFIIGGSRVMVGTGLYLVLAVGINSVAGSLQSNVTSPNEQDETPTAFETDIHNLVRRTTGLAVAFGITYFLILLFNVPGIGSGGLSYLHISNSLLSAISLLVMAVPEGLPLAITLARCIAMAKMARNDNIHVRTHSACETMGRITALCCDKTGTLTTNKMSVTAGLIGTSCLFSRPHDASSMAKSLSPELRQLLVDSIAGNTTAFLSDKGGLLRFRGSSTEVAMLDFAQERLGMAVGDYEQIRAHFQEALPFDSRRKYMASVKRMDNGLFRLFVKGASSVLLERSFGVVVDAAEISEETMTQEQRKVVVAMIDALSSRSLRTLGVAYRDFALWPPSDMDLDADKHEYLDGICRDLTLIGVFGVQDPLRDGVVECIKELRGAGIAVKMVTGDSVETAKAVAADCGILTVGGVAMDGAEFRGLSSLARRQVLPVLQVLARSTPEDKRQLVTALKDLDHTVAVTGDGTNDGPALRSADVGIAMGSGTEVAKVASDIVLNDNNFSSIKTLVAWGRNTRDNVRKFIQFQITTNIMGVVLSLVCGLRGIDKALLTPGQMLWVNLIMDALASLALTTDNPSSKVLHRTPEPESAWLLPHPVLKMIAGQAAYQITVVGWLWSCGGSDSHRLQFIFNTFVFLNFFNLFNNRRIDDAPNIFERIHENNFFMGVTTFILVSQVVAVQYQDALTAEEWTWSVVIGLTCIPVGWIIRSVPTDAIVAVFASDGYRDGTEDEPAVLEAGLLSESPSEPDERTSLLHSGTTTVRYG
ncbi:hypothetical protein OQA88_978 [Cercophora sp. LCS_1]